MSTMQSKLVSRTIWLEKKKIWKINIQKNGIRKSFYSSTPGDKGRKICAQNAASWLSGSSPFAVSDHTTVETVFERYLKDKELETTNIYTIRNRYNNHIKPIIGKIPVMLLTKQDLKRVIYTAYRKCDLSQKSLKNIRGDLSGFCNYLDLSDIRNDLRTNNIRIPSTAKKGKKQALDVVSLDILFSESQAPYNGTVCQDSLIYAYRFNVVTGMRTGELMGLEWGDIDDNYIHIRRAINAKGITTSGKNEFAARDFPQTRYTRMLLDSQKVYRVNPLDPHERVFGPTGQLCYRKRWGIYCNYNGIPYITPYELRHTFSSIYKNVLSNWVYETSMILDTTGRDKEGKAAISVITNKLLAIGRLGRALGIHLLVATQRPDVGSVPGSLKAQLDGRICGHMADAQSSIVILDDGSAANLPAIPGRFIIRNGSGTDDIVQAYYYHK